MQKLPRQTQVAQPCPFSSEKPTTGLSLPGVSMKPITGGFAFPGVLSFLVDLAVSRVLLSTKSCVSEV